MGDLDNGSIALEKKHVDEETIPQDQAGMTMETKDLYRDDPRSPWEEWSPDDIGINAQTTSASNKFALVVRREKRNGDTEEPVLALHSISVQSPVIKTQLGPVFMDYHGINTNLKILTFNAPFHEFFYRWTEFLQARPSPAKDPDSTHYKLLFDAVAPEVKPHIDQAEDLLNNNVISFDYLWTLFPPGTELYSRVDEQDRFYLLVGSRYTEFCGMKMFSLTCRYVDTDGTEFGFATTNLTIGDFENVKPIADLNVLPSHLKPNREEIRKTLDARGRKFEQLKGFHCSSYDGLYMFKDEVPFGGSKKKYVSL